MIESAMNSFSNIINTAYEINTNFNDEEFHKSVKQIEGLRWLDSFDDQGQAYVAEYCE